MAISTPNSTAPAAAPGPTNQSAFAMVTTLFFMWGFLTCLNDILVPHLKAIFDLNYAEAALVQFAFFSSYFIFSFPSGKIIDWFGYQKAMVAGLMTMGLGALLFIPAAAVPSYPVFLSALIVLAAGMTILQVSANPYVAVLGPPQTASSRLNLAQAFNSLGTTLAPWFGGSLIISGAALSVEELHKLAAPQLQAYRLHEASSVKLPYLGLALALIILGVIIASFKLPVLSVESHGDPSHHVHDSVWKYRHLVLGALGIFVYVGAEVSIGSFLVNYLSQPDIGNVTAKTAAGMLSYYWGGAMVGRFVGSALLQKISTGKLLGFNALMASLLVFVSMLFTGHVAVWSILLVGFFNSIMFPSIFTMSIEGLGTLTGHGSSVLVAAIVGGALIPLAQGALADHFTLHRAFLLPAVCYLYIFYFALWGSRRTKLPAAA